MKRKKALFIGIIAVEVLMDFDNSSQYVWAEVEQEFQTVNETTDLYSYNDELTAIEQTIYEGGSHET